MQHLPEIERGSDTRNSTPLKPNLQPLICNFKARPLIQFLHQFILGMVDQDFAAHAKPQTDSRQGQVTAPQPQVESLSSGSDGEGKAEPWQLKLFAT